MNPYRVPPPQPVNGKPRSKLKTKYLKLLIWWKGSWKDRFSRCEYCGKKVFPINESFGIDAGPFFHKMHCAPLQADRNRHRDNYYFAIADDEVGENPYWHG